jgi:hypothetical protein
LDSKKQLVSHVGSFGGLGDNVHMMNRPPGEVQNVNPLNCGKCGKKKENNGAHPSKWCKPPPRYFKVNVDGSFHHDSHARSIGAVIRDSKGEFIAVLTLFLPHMASLTADEAMEMKEGLSLANRLSCSNVIMESDSLETIEA